MRFSDVKRLGKWELFSAPLSRSAYRGENIEADDDDDDDVAAAGEHVSPFRWIVCRPRGRGGILGGPKN